MDNGVNGSAASCASPRGSIISIATSLVHGDRQSSYGHPADDFAKTAGMLNALFARKLRDGEGFTPADIGMVMICVKLSREENAHKADNLIDIAGYAETVALCREREQGSG